MPHCRKCSNFLAVLWGTPKPLANWTYQNVWVQFLINKQSRKKIKKCNNKLMLYIIFHCYLNNMSRRRYTSSAISKIGLFDMTWPKASCMWVCKNRYSDHYQIPPGDSLVRQSFLPPWCFHPVMGLIIRLFEGPQEEKDLKEWKGWRWTGPGTVEPHCGPHCSRSSASAHGILSV